MGIAFGPHLKRYKDIAMLLVKYGNSDLVKSAGLKEALTDEEGNPKPGKALMNLDQIGTGFGIKQ